MRSGLKEGKCKGNGLNLHYLEWGETTSPPVLLLHGFLSQASIWHSLATSLSRNYRVLALNQRGHGRSDWSSTGDYSIDDHFADLVFFLEALDIDDVILIGHSMGGRNALFYAACRPESIRKLLLVDARPGNSDQAVEALRRMLDLAVVSESDIETFLEQAEALYPDIPLKVAYDRLQPGSETSTHLRKSSFYDPWLVVASRLANNLVEDLWAFMPNIQCPTLILRGEYSTFVSDSDAADMNRLIPNAKVEVIRGTGHLPMLENSSTFNRAVSVFLSESSRV